MWKGIGVWVRSYRPYASVCCRRLYAQLFDEGATLNGLTLQYILLHNISDKAPDDVLRKVRDVGRSVPRAAACSWGCVCTHVGACAGFRSQSSCAALWHTPTTPSHITSPPPLPRLRHCAAPARALCVARPGAEQKGDRAMRLALIVTLTRQLLAVCKGDMSFATSPGGVNKFELEVPFTHARFVSDEGEGARVCTGGNARCTSHPPPRRRVDCHRQRVNARDPLPLGRCRHRDRCGCGALGDACLPTCFCMRSAAPQRQSDPGSPHLWSECGLAPFPSDTYRSFPIPWLGPAWGRARARPVQGQGQGQAPHRCVGHAVYVCVVCCCCVCVCVCVCVCFFFGGGP
jgi:hypothetical protein